MPPAAHPVPADSIPGDLPAELLPLVRALARMAERRQRAAAQSSGDADR
jgi:hypothetical protein